ncbi:multidrug effflux MFS transporter [Paradesertivirga mongoliensis]|uniref:Multidrug effflux MFS transporter n=1 Tax=Paradesertivirga mongoliensis TaxID=2100740 RepID=A0ABW4ZHU0_9SPHI|nr:multidrug effflux MFS transporter [Pedobacter mongoliensis]
MQKKTSTALILTLGLLSATSSLSIDMYLPGFPAIAEDLNTSIPQVALSLTSYFVGIAAGQLFFGPIIDRYGRKGPLMFGVVLYFLSSLACALTTSVEGLIIFRFLQALGGCAGMVINRAMVRDLYDNSETARIFSILMLIMGVSPIIAPTFGGYITAGFGWRYVFVTITFIALLQLISSWRVLPETRGADRSASLLPKPVISRFWLVFKQPQFLTYALTSGFGTAAMFAYIAGSPFVFMELFEVSETQYGWIFGGNAFGLIFCSQFNRYLLRRYTSKQIILPAVIFQFLSGVLLALGVVTGYAGATGVFTLIFLFVIMQGFITPNATSLLMEPFEKNTGIASALSGSMLMIFAGLSSATVSSLHNGTTLPMAGVIAGFLAGSFFSIVLGRLMIKKARGQAQTEL